MFDIGWSEMAVVALLALIVIGPKDLPRVMRTASHWVRKARGLAREFQSGIDDMIREADLEDAKKALDNAKRLDIDKAVENVVDPTGEVGDEARSIDKTARDTGAGKGAESAKVAEEVPDDSKESTPSGDDPPGATIVKQPLRVAPPHSVKPPQEDEPEAPPAPKRTAGKKASGKKVASKKAASKKASEKTA